jgi:hypothetical protein
MQQNQLVQGQTVDQLQNVTNYFYKLNRAGIGKNYIATYVLFNSIFIDFFLFF